MSWYASSNSQRRDKATGQGQIVFLLIQRSCCRCAALNRGRIVERQSKTKKPQVIIERRRKPLIRLILMSLKT
ncbi:hypothetical protein NQZ68_001301 [Dissostichus eleginoides]|nr:hypothetical protein NQZ68_001301 [Dissostichus eleginoides]